MTSLPFRTLVGTAELVGTIRQPKVLLRFGWGAQHAQTGQSLVQWCKQLPGRVWNPEKNAWEVNSFGPNPDAVLAAAGFELHLPDEGELSGVTELEQLYVPVSMLASNNRTVLIRTRFCGFEGTQKLIDNAGVWDKERELLKMSVVDVVRGASPRPGIIWDPKAVERSYEVHADSPLLTPELGPHVAALANALEPRAVAAHIKAIQSHLGGPVGKFGVDLFPYQVVGAYGVAGGHTLLADSPGVGKTFQSLAAAAALRSEVLVVICPPVVTTNWAREVVKSGFATDDEIATYRTGRKEPSLDTAKVIIVADSTLAARPHLIHHLGAWMNRHEKVLIVYDEIHRAKSMGSKRSDAVLDMAALAPHARRVGITGTPVLAGPHELVPILEFTGHLGPVFGGAGPFLEEFCTRDRFGAFHPRKRALPALHKKLNEHVWVRRTKAQVLPFLPQKHITSVELDVDLKEYRRTHRDVVEQIVKWFEDFHKQEGRFPNEAEVEDFAADNLRYASELRKAAGMTKVPTAIEMVSDWVKGNPDEPVLVWAHHKDVIAALHETAVKAGVQTGVIAGGISDTERTRLVDAFQAGKIPVLVCSITAAGVGITLTRSSNALFVESDWTPALMLQAMDRCVLEGQLVVTKRGMVAIEEIEVGDLVLTSGGDWHPVTDKWSRNVRASDGRKRITSIDYAGSPVPLRTTHDHDVLVLRKGAVKPEWAHAHTVLPGDYLCTPRMKSPAGLSSIEFPERHRLLADKIPSGCIKCGNTAVVSRWMCSIHYRRWVRDFRAVNGPGAPLPTLVRRKGGAGHIPAPTRVAVDDDFAYVCGWFLAEGWASTHPGKGSFLGFAFHTKEHYVAARIGRYFEQWGYRYKIEKKPVGQRLELRVYARDFAHWFKEAFGHGARNKRFP
ncbi:MAG: SNF2-related protein, partial [Coriobacteriia bacterium]|nr:SNF2-related protein [Coriobacteriia bacterium]